MAIIKPCNHTWIYGGGSCCYRLKCSKCDRQTTAYLLTENSIEPNIGDPVKLDGETIEVIGSSV